MKEKRLLIINLGGTSTKVGFAVGGTVAKEAVIRHSDKVLCQFSDLWEQYTFRREAVLKAVMEKGYHMEEFDAIVSRGAPVKPLDSGCYAISERMLTDARSGVYGIHPCSVGCQIAFDLAEELSVPALTIDAPCIDELIPEARITGLRGTRRKSFYHALNQKAVGRRLAQTIGTSYDKMNAVIAHMGGGMSIAAHRKGRVIDVNNGLDGDGPMAPERAGTVPAGSLLKMAYSRDYTYQELYAEINGRGGLFALLGTKDGREVERRIAAGDGGAKLAYDAMIYQIAKCVGSAAISLKGQVDAIALTGGLSFSQYLVDGLTEWCGFLAPIYLFPGEDELRSLAEGAQLALSGQWPIQNY